jgi:hypothetical protein
LLLFFRRVYWLILKTFSLQGFQAYGKRFELGKSSSYGNFVLARTNDSSRAGRFRSFLVHLWTEERTFSVHDEGDPLSELTSISHKTERVFSAPLKRISRKAFEAFL